MKARLHRTPAGGKKQGRYHSVDEAIRQKQATLLKVLAGADLTRFMDTNNSGNANPNQGQPTGDNVSDVPYEEVK